MSAPALQALGVFVLAVTSTPEAVLQALALKATNTGPLAWAATALTSLRQFVADHTRAAVTAALLSAATLVGVTLSSGTVAMLAGAAASAMADVATAAAAVAAAAI